MTLTSYVVPLLLTGNSIVFAQQSIVTDWWQYAVIYQIYPRTYKDSNMDGNGDLQGIISKLDHLRESNIDAIWLSPIYSSPHVDGGYDISDYRSIDPIYGTMHDFEELVIKAKKMGMRILMDLVPNHSSDQHEWFKKSVRREGRYTNYYVWMDGKGEDGMDPPTNWNSVFSGSAWTYHPKRDQFYLHQFAKEQPDLNFENPDVVEEMKDIITFWLDKGVNGFRIDAIAHLFEEYLDEPIANTGADPIGYDYHKHIHTTNLYKTYDMVVQWRELVDLYSLRNGGEARIIMTEAYNDIKEIMRYYGEDDKLGSHFPFNFDLTGLKNDTDARDIVSLIHRWFAYMPVGYTPNWVLGNHDQRRIATRLQSRNVASMMNMLSAVLPGVMVTYNGEEIGMQDGEVTFEQRKDPRAINSERFDETSRDFGRTPFHWDCTYNAGFTDNYVKPWLPVSRKYVINNLETERKQPASVYQNYKAVTALRRNSLALCRGTWEIYSINKDGILVFRKYPGERTVIFICHMGITNNAFKINLKKYGYESNICFFEVVASNIIDKFRSTISLPNSIITARRNEFYVLLEAY